MLVCMGVGGNFSRGEALIDFPNIFLRGDKYGEIWSLPLEIKKTAFFAEILKFLPLFRHPCFCAGKRSCHTIKNWCNFKRFNTNLGLNLIRKVKYLTDEFQLCLSFCIGSTKYLYFVSALAAVA